VVEVEKNLLARCPPIEFGPCGKPVDDVIEDGAEDEVVVNTDDGTVEGVVKA
jgi:hypothetical protein